MSEPRLKATVQRSALVDALARMNTGAMLRIEARFDTVTVTDEDGGATSSVEATVLEGGAYRTDQASLFLAATELDKREELTLIAGEERLRLENDALQVRTARGRLESFAPPAPEAGVVDDEKTTATADASPFAIQDSHASFGARLGAIMIDGIILGVVLVALVLGAGPPGFVIALLLLVGYQVAFEGSPSGQTVGKRITHVRVVDANSGEPIGYGRAFVRHIGRVASSSLFYLGYLWMLWDDKKQTWHDKIANSIVVRENALPVSSWPGWDQGEVAQTGT